AKIVALGAVGEPEKVREAVRDRRLIALFFDLTSMQQDEVLRAVGAGTRFVREQMSPADLVCIFVFTNQLRPIAPFTNNKEGLLRVIQSIRLGKDSDLAGGGEGTTASGEDASTEDTGAAFTADDTEFNIFNTDRKLAALEGVAEMLRGIPGKKSVIQFTGGITQTGQENRSQLRAATDAANRANVSLYTVDVRGLMAAAPGGDASVGSAAGTAMFSGASVFRQAASKNDSRDTLATLATDTGGRSFFDIGDFKEVFDKVHEDNSGYYLLGYYSSNVVRDGRWRNVKVKMEKGAVVPAGIKVRFREGYYAAKDFGVFTAEDKERQLDEAMRAENPRVELGVALETAQFRLNNDEVFVPVAAKLASSALEWAGKRGRKEAQFDFAAEVREDRTGRPVAALRDMIKVKLDTEHLAQMQQKAIVYQGGVIVGPGNYRLKFLVRENETGRIGTFEQELIVSARHTDRLELSTLFLSSQIEPVRKQTDVQKKALAPDAKMQHSPLEVGGDRVIPSVTRVFTTQQKLYVLFQAYVPSKMESSNLRAGLVFFRNGQRVSDTPLVEAAEFDAKTHTAVFRLALPLEKFNTGRYTVQAVAIETGGEHSAFARTYFALRTPPIPPAAKAAASGGK
ncbi:MAG: VWA domain-containing protein, partial [Acidobacteria bacterium]|nr:VWA domain-containing protein [Acidobacteriota bacterium]